MTFNFKIEEIKREERRREKVDARQKAAGQHIMVTTRIEQRHGSTKFTCALELL